MSSTDSAKIRQFLVDFTWTLLSIGPHVHERFRHVIPTHHCLEEYLRSFDFSFCPGLWDALNNVDPPTISWFENLPGVLPPDVWGVYAMVLRKADCASGLYVGSGTAGHRGMAVRFADHRKHRNAPTRAIEAWSDGWVTSCIVPLFTIPIPTAAKVPTVRAVVVALEAAFHCLFWSMESDVNPYYFGDNCPWSPQIFEYFGFCSHNPLIAHPTGGGKELSESELEHAALARSENTRQYQRNYGKQLRANPTPEYKARYALARAKQKPKTRQNQLEAIKNKKHYCDACDVSCRDASELRRHIETPRHEETVIRGGEHDWPCEPCQERFRHQSDLTTHKLSKYHRDVLSGKKIVGGPRPKKQSRHNTTKYDPEGEYSCHTCRFTFKFASLLLAHEATQQHQDAVDPPPPKKDAVYRCEPCDFERKFPSLVRQHMALQHCATRFVNLGLEYDRQEEHQNVVECVTCDIHFIGRPNYEYHLLSEAHQQRALDESDFDPADLDEPCPCVVCEEVYADWSDFKAHVHTQEHIDRIIASLLSPN